MPDHPGRWRIALKAVEWSPLLRTLAKPVVVRLKDGTRLVVDGSSQTGRIAYATGEYEPRTTAIIKQRVLPGATVVDVGANIGFFSIVAARAAGPSGRVLAFEPVTGTRAALEQNVALNGLTNVVIRSQALAAETGVATFYRGPAEDTGLASLRALATGGTLHIQTCRFDDIYDHVSPVALVKIDVEGAELGVLQGMRATLARYMPDIVLEVTDTYLRALGASAAQLIDFLHALGYRIWLIPEDGPLRPIAGESDLEACPEQFNAFCSRDQAVVAL
jgi:FkbM family methyltransferase